MTDLRLLKKQVQALREANNLLRQSVPPEKRKYLSEPPAVTEDPPTFRDRFRKILPKIAKILAVIVVLGGIAALIGIEIAILLPKQQEKEPEKEELVFSVSTGRDVCFGADIAKAGDTLFYRDSKKGYLYSVGPDGKRKASDAVEIFGLSLSETGLYYIKENGETLRRYDVNTKKKTDYLSVSVNKALITENGIYALAAADSSLRLYEKDGMSYQTLSKEPVIGFEQIGNELWFLTKSGKLFLYGENEPKAENVTCIGRIEGILFCAKDGYLYKIIDSDFSLTEIRGSVFAGEKNRIITSDPENPHFLYLWENGESRLISGDFSKGITVADQDVFFGAVDGRTYRIRLGENSERSLIG